MRDSRRKFFVDAVHVQDLRPQDVFFYGSFRKDAQLMTEEGTLRKLSAYLVVDDDIANPSWATLLFEAPEDTHRKAPWNLDAPVYRLRGGLTSLREAAARQGIRLLIRA